MGIIVRQSIKGTLFTYIGAFIGFVTTLYIVPKYIGDELYGLTRVMLEAALLLAALFQLGASSSIMRFFPYFSNRKNNNNGFFFYMISWISLGCVIFIPCFFLFKDIIITYFSAKSPLFTDYLYWLIPFTFFLIYWLTFEVYSNVLMRIAFPRFIREVLLRCLVITLYLVYAWGYIDITGFVTGFISIYGIAMVTLFFYISRISSLSLKHDNSFITQPLKKDFLSYTSVILLGSLGGTLVSKIDIFMISGEMGLSWTGIYSIAFYMISIVDIPSRSISAISTPIAAEALKKGNFEEANALYKKVSLHQLLIGSMIFLLIWINIENIYAIIPNGEVYSAGKWVVLFIGLSKLIEITIGFGGVLISFSKYYHWSLYFMLFISGITIFFNWLLIPKFGISGAAIATTITALTAYSVQQIIVLIKIKANPYSLNTLKVIALFLLLFFLNRFLPETNNPWLDLFYRSAIIFVIGILLIYFFKISDQANLLLTSFLQKIKRFIKK